MCVIDRDWEGVRLGPQICSKGWRLAWGIHRWHLGCPGPSTRRTRTRYLLQEKPEKVDHEKDEGVGGCSGPRPVAQTFEDRPGIGA